MRKLQVIQLSLSGIKVGNLGLSFLQYILLLKYKGMPLGFISSPIFLTFKGIKVCHLGLFLLQYLSF